MAAPTGPWSCIVFNVYIKLERSQGWWNGRGGRPAPAYGAASLRREGWPLGQRPPASPSLPEPTRAVRLPRASVRPA